MSTSGSTTIDHHVVGIDDAYVWLNWVNDDPSNPCYSRWTLMGRWGSAGTPKTGNSAYIKGTLTSGVFGHDKDHAVATGEFIVLYGPYISPSAPENEQERRIICCFYINSESIGANSYSQIVNYYIEREWHDETVSPSVWRSDYQWTPKQVKFTVRRKSP